MGFCCDLAATAFIQPLKDFFGITSFIYQKNFFDGSEVCLGNQPEWIKFFYQHRLFQDSVFEHTPDIYTQKHVLWNTLREHHQVLHEAKQFQIDHGITFIQPQSDGVEFFCIGTTPDRLDVMPRYLNNLDLLTQFLSYFKQKAAPLLQLADKNRILIPGKHNHNSTSPLLGSTQIDRQAFLASLAAKNLQQFSPRERDCIKLLTRGYNLKMIAQALDLSYRTVETHVQHIKQKANCHTKAELIRFLATILEAFDI